jgi:hypothetical protein
VCLIGLVEARRLWVGLWGRVVLSSVIVAGVVDRIGVAAGAARYTVLGDIVAEAVVGIEVALVVFEVGRRDVDGCQAVLGLSPYSIPLLPFGSEFFFFDGVSICEGWCWVSEVRR